jgi:hypothetical protein
LLLSAGWLWGGDAGCSVDDVPEVLPEVPLEVAPLAGEADCPEEEPPLSEGVVGVVDDPLLSDGAAGVVDDPLLADDAAGVVDDPLLSEDAAGVVDDPLPAAGVAAWLPGDALLSGLAGGDAGAPPAALEPLAPLAPLELLPALGDCASDCRLACALARSCVALASFSQAFFMSPT